MPPAPPLNKVSSNLRQHKPSTTSLQTAQCPVVSSLRNLRSSLRLNFFDFYCPALGVSLNSSSCLLSQYVLQLSFQDCVFPVPADIT